jgi:hypothetical protein
LIETVLLDQFQQLHQTLVEFIQLPEFRNLVLEERYQVVEENGFSILMKYKILEDNLLSQCDVPHRVYVTMSTIFLHYVREVESTTGKSASLLFKGGTWRRPQHSSVFPQHLAYEYYMILEAAPAGGLKLLLKDALKYDNGVYPTRTPLTLPIFLHMIQSGRMMQPAL